MGAYVLDSKPAEIAHPLLESIIQALEDRSAAGGSFPNYTKVVLEPGAGERAADTVRAAMAAVDSGATPDEAAAYREWLLGIATAVAQAGKEDQGFLGRGGVLVNDRERAMLRDLAAMLGLEAPAI